MAKLIFHDIEAGNEVSHKINVSYVTSIERVGLGGVVHLIDGQKISLSKEAADGLASILDAEERLQNGV